MYRLSSKLCLNHSNCESGITALILYQLELDGGTVKLKADSRPPELMQAVPNCETS